MKFEPIKNDKGFEMPEQNYDFIHDIISVANDNLITQMNNITIEGLKRKGFEFENNYELTEFLKARCRVTEFENERTYYVDDKPFLLHRQDLNINMNNIVDAQDYKLTATYGGYAYL